MNIIEAQMVALLKELRDKFAVVGVKAEFEAEGTRTEELMRLKEICLSAGADLTLKIGGCEAVRDMYDASSVGVNHLVAPMVETPFALRKYLKAAAVAFQKDEIEEIDFLVNIETLQAAENFPAMLAIPESHLLDGIVIGRSDLIGSMGLASEEINSERVFKITRDLLVKAKEKKLCCVVGGTITVQSIPFLKRLSDEKLLDRFETRKVCFACPAAFTKDTAAGINQALIFELLWLRNKKEYYQAISQEDGKRLDALEKRLNVPA